MDTDRRRYFGRSFSVLAVLVSIGVSAAAFDIPVEGKKVVAKSEPAGKPRFVFRGLNPDGAFFDPSSGTTTVIATEVDCDGAPIDELCMATATSGVIELDPTLWTPLGNPAGSKGYRYRDPDATRGGIQKALLRSNGKISIKAGGDDWPLEPTGTGNALLVRLTRDDTVYCAELGGTEKRNQPGFVSRKSAPAPAVCRSACGNGIVENGEECDPPDGGECQASCQLACPPRAGSTLIDCALAGDGTLALAGYGDTFMLAYTQDADEGTSVGAVRFDSVGQRLDTTPLLISDGEFPANNPLAAADENGFHALWTSDSHEHGQRRRVPFAGDSLGPIVVVDTRTTGGFPSTCTPYKVPVFGLGASLGGGDPLVSRALEGPCWDPILFDLPDVGFSLEPFTLDYAPASFARGDSATAFAWWRRVAFDAETVTNSIMANRLEPTPLPSGLHLTYSPPLTYPPVLAAIGDLYMVAWAAGSEVRGTRFMFPDTVLDGEGGFLIASLSGAAEAPAITADDARFVVAWRQNFFNDRFHAVHVGTDGTVEEPVPLPLATAPDISDIGLAAGTSATWAAFSTAETSGARAIRIVEVP